MQTLRAVCSKAEPKICDGQNLIIWRWSSLNCFLDLQTQFDEDRCTQFQVIVVTDPQHTPTNKQTNRADYNTLYRSLVCSVKMTLKCN